MATETASIDGASVQPNPVPLTKITLSYDLEQDRVGLAGQSTDDRTVKVWLTQRLLRRLVPHLIRFCRNSHLLGRLSHGPEGATAGAQPASGQAPVELKQNSEAFLAVAVDVSEIDDAVILTFRGNNNASAVRFGLPTETLETWLRGLRRCIDQGEWLVDGWETLEALPTGSTSGTVTVH